MSDYLTFLKTPIIEHQTKITNWKNYIEDEICNAPLAQSQSQCSESITCSCDYHKFLNIVEKIYGYIPDYNMTVIYTKLPTNHSCKYEFAIVRRNVSIVQLHKWLNEQLNI
jgi:hypothetical protein